METRLVVAYSLIAALTVVGAAIAWVLHRQRARRRRRLRGIKDQGTETGRRTLA